MAHGLHEVLHEGARLKFKVEIRKLNLPSTDGFLFSILNPKTGEPIYEFIDRYEKFGREKSLERIQLINKLLTYWETLKKEKESDEDSIPDN